MFIKISSNFKTGSLDKLSPQSRIDMIYKEDGIFKLIVYTMKGGQTHQETYIESKKAGVNTAFWLTSEGAQLQLDLAGKLTGVSKELVEELPDLSGYFFYTIPYTYISKMYGLRFGLKDLDGSLVKFWDADGFKLGFNNELEDKKSDFEAVLTEAKIKFTK
jgi:hypothetical protein